MPFTKRGASPFAERVEVLVERQVYRRESVPRLAPCSAGGNGQITALAHGLEVDLPPLGTIVAEFPANLDGAGGF